MRFIAADVIFPVSGPAMIEHVLVISDKGEILNIIHSSAADQQKTEYFKGALVPGFVNAHCHLELSHLKEKLTRGAGLSKFTGEIGGLIKKDIEKGDAAISADIQMLSNGIVAAGDICNTPDTITLKEKSHIYYHNFIEIFAIDPGRAAATFSKGMQLKKQFLENKLNASITLHAPYSASELLIKFVAGEEKDKIFSIHNQESREENKMFLSGEGEILERIKSSGFLKTPWKAYNISSIKYLMKFLPEYLKIQLVHNTFTSSEEVDETENYFEEVSWCLCPSANLYIENTLPDAEMFFKKGVNVTIGTDSLASNSQLSILEEIKILQENFKIPTEALINWSTLNGAKFLGIDKIFGSFEKQKKPGVNRLFPLDKDFNFIPQTIVQRII